MSWFGCGDWRPPFTAHRLRVVLHHRCSAPITNDLHTYSLLLPALLHPAQGGQQALQWCH
ncbi:MAG: hypothetical protein COW59_07115 [Lysobacterales bacterium CG17_big_fil_post_rev_8_21_14_2_50_64_11]|nr:MAG: hypothetical protein COW59_07115 [Xanthomonadales bacterium CG17_big_fil_post_rev_8_21_14_2_50_64_11]PIX60996.1 MAG: hypothetical protein COZ47_04230 [Xanthomonadales bacterium CG_4_10_14_3_um_filter_64_11]